jgi:hypothetical protein
MSGGSFVVLRFSISSFQLSISIDSSLLSTLHGAMASVSFVLQPLRNHFESSYTPESIDDISLAKREDSLASSSALLSQSSSPSSMLVQNWLHDVQQQQQQQQTCAPPLNNSSHAVRRSQTSPNICEPDQSSPSSLLPPCVMTFCVVVPPARSFNHRRHQSDCRAIIANEQPKSCNALSGINLNINVVPASSTKAPKLYLNNSSNHYYPTNSNSNNNNNDDNAADRRITRALSSSCISSSKSMLSSAGHSAAVQQPPLKLLSSFSPANFATTVYHGLSAHAPSLADEGEGGAWLMRNSNGESVAVFKPMDQEPFSLANPKSPSHTTTDDQCTNKSRVVHNAMTPNTGSLKELAAYVIDRSSGGKSRVPETVMAEISHNALGGSKIGSLQQYVRNSGSAEDMGSSKFSTRDVHFIGVLDCMLLNCDRHAGNLLLSSPRVHDDENNENLMTSTANAAESLDGYDEDVQSATAHRKLLRLTPIDHAFSLPEAAFLSRIPESNLWFEWMNFAQSRKPFSQAALKHIASINIEKHAADLEAIGLNHQSVLTMCMCTYALQRAAASGKTLFEIGKFFCQGALSACYDQAVQQSSAVPAMSTATNSPLFRAFQQVIDKFFAL